MAFLGLRTAWTDETQSTVNMMIMLPALLEKQYLTLYRETGEIQILKSKMNILVLQQNIFAYHF